MHLTCLQLNTAWQDKPRNFARVRHLLLTSPPPPGSLILLPEMFATGFSMNVDAIAEPAHGPTHTFLANLARELRSTIIAGLVRKAPSGQGQNRALILSPTGQTLADYAKIHPFSLGYESLHYAGGNQVLTFPWHVGDQTLTVTPAICYDLRFPELFRRAARQGAQLFAIIASWPAARHDHWVTLLRARAIENQAYVAAVNRTGADPHTHYIGRSLIISPKGQLLADAGSAETRISAEIHPAAVADFRRSFPALRDLRSDLFPQ